MPNRRPKLELLGSSASPEEAAAVVAAVERFLRETAPPAAPAAGSTDNPWHRAGVLEGTGQPLSAGGWEASAWGDPHPWGQ